MNLPVSGEPQDACSVRHICIKYSKFWNSIQRLCCTPATNLRLVWNGHMISNKTERSFFNSENAILPLKSGYFFCIRHHQECVYNFRNTRGHTHSLHATVSSVYPAKSKSKYDAITHEHQQLSNG